MQDVEAHNRSRTPTSRFMAIPPKVAASFAVLSLSAAAALGALLFVTMRQPALEHATGEVATEEPAAAPALVYAPMPIGLPVEGHPIVNQVALADLDQDGLLDVLVCDATANQVGWIRQFPRGEFTETRVGEAVVAPVRVMVCDLNQDGRPDLLVASIGTVYPDNDRIGRIVAMENLGENRFSNRVLADNLPRARDVRVADLNGDGRLDIVAGLSGIDVGEIRWMENLGNWDFRSHVVSAGAGAVAVAVADFEGAGKPGMVALSGGEPAEVRLFRALPDGKTEGTALWSAAIPAWGGSGLEVCDLNGDGRADLLCANGDGASTSGFSEPSPWHGLQWFENLGGSFQYRRIDTMPGCHSPVAVDLDGDGDMDVVAVSAYNHAIDPDAVWINAWLNDGRQNFTAVPLARDPPRLSALAVGDLDGNGVPVLVTGAFHAYPPFTRLSRVTLWRRQ